MSQDFLDDERRRLAYADRSPTLERKETQPIGSAAEYERKAQAEAAFKVSCGTLWRKQ